MYTSCKVSPLNKEREKLEVPRKIMHKDLWPGHIEGEGCADMHVAVLRLWGNILNTGQEKTEVTEFKCNTCTR